MAKLNQDIIRRKNVLRHFKLKSDIIDELETKGFGINEFRTLSYMLDEIGVENNYSFEGIRKEFFDDLKNYEVIGSRKERDKLRNELKNLEPQQFLQT